MGIKQLTAEDIPATRIDQIEEAEVISIEEPFFMGPVSLSWLTKASSLKGRALHVGFAVLHQARLSGRNRVQVTPSLRNRFGLSRHDSYKGIKQLAKANLVIIETQKRGCSVTVIVHNHIPKGGNWTRTRSKGRAV